MAILIKCVITVVEQEKRLFCLHLKPLYLHVQFLSPEYAYHITILTPLYKVILGYLHCVTRLIFGKVQKILFQQIFHLETT